MLGFDWSLGELVVFVLFGLALATLRYAVRQRNRFSRPREASQRNLPYLFLIFAIMLGLLALIIPLAGWLAMANGSDLKFVAGSVQRAPSWGVDGDVILIRVETNEGLHDLVVEDLSHSREIMELKPGDYVTALVKPFVGDYDIWELKRDGVTIESYQETYVYRTRQSERGQQARFGSG